jgi:hypothetical protein
MLSAETLDLLRLLEYCLWAYRHSGPQRIYRLAEINATD